MNVTKVFLDPRGINFMFVYTDEFIPYDSYITIDNIPANDSYVYRSIDGWNPSISSINQGVIGFDYTGSSFYYGDTFVLVTSSGNLTVSNYITAVDAVAAQLTTSLNNYINTSQNNWVNVTSAEYANIYAYVNNIRKIGGTDSQILNNNTQDSGTLGANGSNVISSSRFISTNIYYNSGDLVLGIAFAADVAYVGKYINPIYTFNNTNPNPNGAIGGAVYIQNSGLQYYILKWPNDIANQKLYPAWSNGSSTSIKLKSYGNEGWAKSVGSQFNNVTNAPGAQWLVTDTISWPFIT